jgi:hypothetical protein
LEQQNNTPFSSKGDRREKTQDKTDCALPADGICILRRGAGYCPRLTRPTKQWVARQGCTGSGATATAVVVVVVDLHSVTSIDIYDTLSENAYRPQDRNQGSGRIVGEVCLICLIYAAVRCSRTAAFSVV